MKALSLKQPWAELVVSGKKTIETRNWNTSFRGEFLVHASGNPNPSACAYFTLVNPPGKCIIGKVTLVSVKKYETKQQWDADKHLHLALSDWDGKPRYGFVLTNPQRLPERPCNGMLNFFEVSNDFARPD